MKVQQLKLGYPFIIESKLFGFNMCLKVLGCFVKMGMVKVGDL